MITYWSILGQIRNQLLEFITFIPIQDNHSVYTSYTILFLNLYNNLKI